MGGDDSATLRFLRWGRLDSLYAAVVQAIEEAVLDAMIANADMTGREERRVPALPREQLRALLQTRRPAIPSSSVGSD